MGNSESKERRNYHLELVLIRTIWSGGDLKPGDRIYFSYSNTAQKQMMILKIMKQNFFKPYVEKAIIKWIAQIVLGLAKVYERNENAYEEK